MQLTKRFLPTLFVLSAIIAVAKPANERTYAVGFYNLENLFDTCHDAGKNDYEFLPDGTFKWTSLKYSHKLSNMARVLSEMGTDNLPSEGCAAIGVAEVENAKIVMPETGGSGSTRYRRPTLQAGSSVQTEVTAHSRSALSRAAAPDTPGSSTRRTRLEG